MTMLNKTCLLAAVLAAIAFVSAPVCGQTWDYASDFSTTANPNGQWSYGRLNGALTTFTLNPDLVLLDTLNLWHTGDTADPGKIIGGAGDYGFAYFPDGWGFFISPAVTNKPNVRWTAPYAARVQVTATFTGLNVAGSNSDVMILHNLNTTSKVFNSLLQGYGAGGPYPTIGANPVATFAGEVIVHTGDTIDFLASVPTGRTDLDRVGFASSITVLELIDLPNLTGTITDQSTGAKIEGATVKVVGTTYEAVTDDQGAYSIPLAPGTYSLDVSATWYEPKTLTDVVQTAGGTVQDITLGPVVVTSTSWDYAADFDPDNNPTPSSNVPIWSYLRWSDDLTTMTLDDYVFDLSGGRFWWVNDNSIAYCMKAYGNLDIDGAYASAGAACISPGLGPTKGGARWTSPVSGKVWVHAVFSGQGYSPMTNADVHVVRNCGTPQAEELFYDIVTGFVGDGGHPAVGDHPKTGWWGAVDVALHDTIDFIVGDAGDGRLMDITRLDGGVEPCEGTGTVHGVVLDSSTYQPVDGAIVEVLGRSEYAVTDYYGQYSIILPAGDHTLMASKAGVGAEEKLVSLVSDGDKTVDFSLGSGTVQGTVTEAESPNRPLMGAVVTVVGSTQSAVTDENGHYNMSLGAGQYDFRASDAGRVAVTLPATVPSGGSTTVNFALARVASWNYTTDFSSVGNPAGAWSYGWLDSSLSVFTLSDTLVGEGALRFWAYPSVGNPSPGRSIGGPSDYGDPMYAYFPADEGFLISPNGAEKPDAVWTAPFAGLVSISATFKGLQYADPGSNSQVLVFKNDGSATPLFNGTVQGYYGGGGHDPIGTNHTASYTGQVTVAVGDCIHFTAGDTVPSRGSYDRLGFDATITPLEVYPTLAVTGVVSDSVTGSPIPDVPITLVPSGQTSGGVSCMTSATGHYLIYAAAGSYTVAAGLPGVYVPQSASLQVTGSGAVRNFSLARVTSWSMVDEWSFANNPTPSASWPIWTYGRYDYYFTAFFPYLTTYMGYGGGGFWYDNGLYSSAIAAIPGDIDADGSYLPTGTVAFCPAAVGGADGSGVRWTAPYATTVRVNTVWSGRSYSPVTYGEVYVDKNTGGETWEQLNYDIISGFAGGGGRDAVGPYPASVWSGLVSVEKGDTIDFHVAFALGGPRTVTGLAATIAVAGSDTVIATGISSLKTLPDGQFVSITEPKVVTVGTDTFTDGTCYVEDVNRVSGIRVVLGPGLVIDLGQRITVEGVMGTDANGQRTLFVTAITSQANGDPIGPLGAPNRSIKAMMTGASLAGLLVTGWGQIMAKSETGQVIYLDDGSGVIGEPGTTGIKVVLNDTINPTLLEVGTTVAVKGICALNKVGGVTFPAILARNADDVKIP